MFLVEHELWYGDRVWDLGKFGDPGWGDEHHLADRSLNQPRDNVTVRMGNDGGVEKMPTREEGGKTNIRSSLTRRKIGRQSKDTASETSH